MLFGAETPLLNQVTAGARSGQGGAAFDSGKYAAKDLSSAEQRPESDVRDLIDIAADARARVSNNSQQADADGSKLKEVIQEFQEGLDDEERIPPSIFNQMRKLLEDALQKEPDHEVDQVV